MRVWCLLAVGPEDAPERAVAGHLEVVFSGQGLLDPHDIVAFFPQGQVGGGAVREDPFLVVLVQLLHVKAVDGVAHHLIQTLGLLGVGQGDAPALLKGGGQDELLINLVVQVGSQQDEVVFVFLQGHLLGPDRQEDHQDAGEDQNDDKTGQREEFYQSEGVQVLTRAPPRSLQTETFHEVQETVYFSKAGLAWANSF